jgi:hypothetical protein
MSARIRRVLLGVALVLATIDVATAQVETVVVSAERRTGYGGAQGDEVGANEPPHLFLLKRADHVITRVNVTCDTRDFGQRRNELKQTLRAMIRKAAGTGDISLSVGDKVITDLTEAGFDDLITADVRPDTSTATVIIKTKVAADDTLNKAMARVTQFIATTPMSGRTEIVRTGEWDLTIVGPEQYRDAIVTMIVNDARHTAEMFGPANGVEVEGLEHRVSWYQKGPLELALYIPYTLKIAPVAH